MLDGIKVLDFTRVLAGPFATMILGDLGAEIIKIEPPSGDETRLWAPLLNNESVYFLSINRNKKSIVLDLKKEDAKEIVYKLVKESDVVIENFRSGVPERLGIDYNTLKNIKNDIIYCSIKGFGSTSPYESKPSYDLLVQAMSGFMTVTGEKDSPPIRAAFALFDIIAGLIAVNSILAAIIERSRTGHGKFIEVSLYDSAIFSMSYIAEIYLLTGKIPNKMGSAHPSIVPYQAFKCADNKYIAIAVTNEKFWENLCNVLNMKELYDDPRFKTNPDRVKNRNELIPLLEKKFYEKTRDEWLNILEQADVPCAPVYELNEVFQDPHVLSSGIISTINHNTLGQIKQLSYPVLFNNKRPEIRLPPPILGEHTLSILKKLGYSKDQINKLKSNQTIR
ncbi:MAG: CaiB/BaiF CoA transferase family protein [Thermoprotei archaeon]|jgi:formyl-CoA transferase